MSGTTFDNFFGHLKKLNFEIKPNKQIKQAFSRKFHRFLSCYKLFNKKLITVTHLYYKMKFKLQYERLIISIQPYKVNI